MFCSVPLLWSFSFPSFLLRFTCLCSFSFLIFWLSYPYFVFLSFFHSLLCIFSLSIFSLLPLFFCRQFQLFIFFPTLLFFPNLILSPVNQTLANFSFLHFTSQFVLHFLSLFSPFPLTSTLHPLFILSFLVSFFQSRLQNGCAKPILASSCLSVCPSVYPHATAPLPADGFP